MLRTGFILAGAFALSLSVIADASAQRGSQTEQDACARDVTKLCRKVMDQGDMIVLGCLKQNRAKLSKACAKVLTDNGQ
ncbi:hypothetical protein GJW-30_1_03354 [Variibacter gotjawalensis]|uniref:Cysteine rich repeat protein n=1 Tax=Variibacter gotjawalensis TaxID=1333996 RepID=A0A0S3PY49_9BRAD|nr:hypothetical protein [Variibacter gotjawalensis]NIK46639.1 hypothetical protein [Variibacter gotjawalensis]RZS48542.1 hypothetical protein EV661_0957 [Variibacter gotjawalensis]BAT60804.1 hypothetical protein GJW-30_1_03354 [Variibacter gotjawalensis]